MRKIDVFTKYSSFTLLMGETFFPLHWHLALIFRVMKSVHRHLENLSWPSVLLSSPPCAMTGLKILQKRDSCTLSLASRQPPQCRRPMIKLLLCCFPPDGTTLCFQISSLSTSCYTQCHLMVSLGNGLNLLFYQLFK